MAWILAELVRKLERLGPGWTSASARIRPSAFDTTLWAMTSTSSSVSGRVPVAAREAVAIRPARSSPGVTSGQPIEAATLRRLAPRWTAHVCPLSWLASAG